jgi:hypothetical protein
MRAIAGPHHALPRLASYLLASITGFSTTAQISAAIQPSTVQPKSMLIKKIAP